MAQVKGWIGAHWRWLAGGVVAFFAIALLILAAFPWGTLKSTVEARLSRALGRPVTIGSMSREDHFSLHPVIEIRDLTVPQPAWLKGDPLLTVRRARIGFDAVAMLIGTTRLDSLDVEGAHAALLRDANGRTNWGAGKSGGSGGSMPFPRQLSIADSRIRYVDAKRDRRFDISISGDAATGLRLAGNGRLLDAPVTLRGFAGGSGRDRWPFDVRIAGNAIAVHATGSTARPLGFESMVADIEARAPDFAYLDALVEGGLPRTQPVRFTAHVSRAGDLWKIERMAGTIGRSDVAGHATIRQRGDRKRVDGELTAHRFDFHDLSSDAELARDAARNAKFGKHVVPGTHIDLSKMGPTDGVLKLHADELLWPGSKPFRSLDATLDREGDTLRIDPLRFGLPHGSLSGTGTVTQEKAGPRLHLVLTLKGSRITDLFPDAAMDAPLHGRLDLTGTGTSVRAAIGTSSGHVALVADEGTLPDKAAVLLGQDIGRGLFASKKKQAALNCIVARFDFHDGTAKASRVWIDTSRALSRVYGTIRFPDETLELALRGIPKQHVVLRFEDPVPVHGTIKAPDIGKPADANSLGDIIGQIGEAIFGHDNVTTPGLNCHGVAADAMKF